MPDQDDTKKTIPAPEPDEDDVEGHGGMAPRADGGPDEFGRLRSMARVDGDDDDVEGHFGQLRSPSSRGE